MLQARQSALTPSKASSSRLEMQELGKKLIQWFSLDTDEGVAAIEYAVIAGLIIGGILVWAFY
jgi:hypothetical protein